MNMFKKLLCLVCTMALLFTAVPSVLAESSPTLYFSTPALEIGGSQGYCYLIMDYAENVSAMDYIVTYDAENLELVSVNNTGFTNRNDVTVSVNSEEAGVIHVTLLSQNGLSGYGNLNLMYFKAKPTAKVGTYPINVLVNDIYDSNLESVEATTRAGNISVREKSVVVKSTSFSSWVSNSSITVGETVDFTLYAYNLDGLSAGTFEFTYDESKLKFEKLTPATEMKNVIYDVNSERDGLVKMSFVSENIVGNYRDLVYLTFSAIDSGSTKISFKAKDLYDFEFVPMTAGEIYSSVTVKEPVVVIDYPDFEILIPETILSDKEFPVQAVLEGKSKVRAGDFVVNYDKNALECLGVTGETISGAWLSIDKNFADGKVRFSLMSNADLEEDTHLVTIKFKAKENKSSTTMLTTSGSGTYDVEFNPITLEYKNPQIVVVRPEYTVNFYDSNSTTLIQTQKVPSGNDAVPPDTEQIRNLDKENHLKFSGWDKDYTSITEDTDFVAVYKNEAHTGVAINAVDATCTETGLTKGEYCILCSEVLVAQEVVPAKGHVEMILDRVEPTCTETGLTEGKACSVCNEVLVAQETIPAKGHVEVVVSGKDATCTETGLTEGKYCSTCNETLVEQKVVSANGHTEVVLPRVDATCTETGLTKGKYCSVCNKTLLEQEEIPAKGHTESVLRRVEPTCTKTGLTEGKGCSVCGEVFVAQEEIPAKGHTVAVISGREATCTSTGLTDYKYCTTCWSILAYQETIPAKGHTEVLLERVEPTCTNTGLTEGKKCSVCDAILVYQTSIPKKAHTEVVLNKVDATCTETGLTEGKACSVCGGILVAQKTIPAKGHVKVVVSGKDATCTETGLTEGKYCSTCNETLVGQEVIPAKGHVEVVVSGKDATCTETGLTEGKYCSTCSETLVEQEEIPSKGHTEVVLPRVEPTCTETGITEGKSCSVCNEVLLEQEVIPAKGHIYGGWEEYGNLHIKTCVCGNEIANPHEWDEGKITVEPTYETKGEKTYTCMCGATKTEIIDKTSYMPGDPTADGSIDTRDIISIRRYIAGGYGIEIIFDAADINKDRNLDSRDIILLRRYLAGGYGVELK